MIKLKKAFIVMLTAAMLCGNTLTVFAEEGQAQGQEQVSQEAQKQPLQDGTTKNNMSINDGLNNNGPMDVSQADTSGASVADNSEAGGGSQPGSSATDSSGTKDSSSTNTPSDSLAEAPDKERIKGQLTQYYEDLKIRYDLNDAQIKRMDRLYNSAVEYMNGSLMLSELTRYESAVEGYLNEVAKNPGDASSNNDSAADSGNNSNNNNGSGNNSGNNNSGDQPSDQYVSDAWKDQISGELSRYYSDLKILYKLPDEKLKRMDKIYNSAMSYMKNAGLTMTELTSYVTEVRGYLSEIAKKNTTGTEKFLMLSNEVPILDVKYGEQTFVVLSLINLGKNDITDVVVTPTVSNDKTKWPFNIGQAYDAQTIQIIQAADNTTEAFNKRMDVGWYFNVRNDVLTGCYPLPFHATYYQNGELVETDITTYINVKGSDPKKTLIKDTDEEEDKKAANPRIIVTGYRTDPEEVYAGSTFNLTVSVKNTSKQTAVENVLFNMEATVEGKDADATYAAFLPTSGSSSVYTERIAPGQTYDMSIEMEAKSDLSQKPYVLTVNMKYDTEDQVNLTDAAKVSVPIKQEAKLDTGSAEIMPESIAVGEQSNVMFSIFNTGKTTLFNVKVTYESDTVDSGVTYLGNIAPGNTGNVDSMLTGIAPDMGDGIVKAVVTYEDEAGNESRYEKDLNLLVYEMSFDEGMMDDFPTEPIEEEAAPKKIPLAALIGIAVAVVAVIVVIIIIISKKRKAKKHQEDMDLLDGDDES